MYEILCFLFELIEASNPLGKARMADQRSNLCDRISRSQVHQLPTLGCRGHFSGKLAQARLTLKSGLKPVYCKPLAYTLEYSFVLKGIGYLHPTPDLMVGNPSWCFWYQNDNSFHIQAVFFNSRFQMSNCPSLMKQKVW